MANEIFDRETRLDLLVNIIPLFILGFFIVAFLVFTPFGIDPLASSIQFGLIAIPFVLLTVLTYFAGRAVAGSENSGPVYLPGQASVRGAEPLEVPGDGDDESELDDTETAAAELESGDASSEESDADTDADGESDLDAAADSAQDSASDPDDEVETDDDSDATDTDSDTPDDADHSS
jgi:ABC-type antimicrobial peptide transport system permease subunit